MVGLDHLLAAAARSPFVVFSSRLAGETPKGWQERREEELEEFVRGRPAILVAVRGGFEVWIEGGREKGYFADL